MGRDIDTHNPQLIQALGKLDDICEFVSNHLLYVNYPPILNTSPFGRLVLILFGIIEDVGKVAFATVLAVMHRCHEDSSTALQIHV